MWYGMVCLYVNITTHYRDSATDQKVTIKLHRSYITSLLGMVYFITNRYI